MLLKKLSCAQQLYFNKYIKQLLHLVLCARTWQILQLQKRLIQGNEFYSKQDEVNCRGDNQNLLGNMVLVGKMHAKPIASASLITNWLILQHTHAYEVLYMQKKKKLKWKKLKFYYAALTKVFWKLFKHINGRQIQKYMPPPHTHTQEAHTVNSKGNAFSCPVYTNVQTKNHKHDVVGRMRRYCTCYVISW